MSVRPKSRWMYHSHDSKVVRVSRLTKCFIISVALTLLFVPVPLNDATLILEESFLHAGDAPSECGGNPDGVSLHLYRWEDFPVIYAIHSSVPSQFHDAIRQSFATWDAEEHPAGGFFDEGQEGEEDILVTWSSLDGPGEFLAVAAVAYSFGTAYYAEIVLDSSETWHVYDEISCDVEKPAYAGGSSDYPGFDVEGVVAHEVGHAIGINHYDELLLTMHDEYQGTKMRTLAIGDQYAIESRYEGEPGGGGCDPPRPPGCTEYPTLTT